MINNEIQLKLYKEKLEKSKEWTEEFQLTLDSEKLELSISFKDSTHRSWEQFIILNTEGLKLDLKYPEMYKEYTKESFDKLTNMFYRIYRIYINDNKW